MSLQNDPKWLTILASCHRDEIKHGKKTCNARGLERLSHWTHTLGDEEGLCVLWLSVQWMNAT
jgi:hypothetical protein